MQRPGLSPRSAPQPLDLDESDGDAVGGDAALTYNSDTVDVRPVIQAQLTSSGDDPRGLRGVKLGGFVVSGFVFRSFARPFSEGSTEEGNALAGLASHPAQESSAGLSWAAHNRHLS